MDSHVATQCRRAKRSKAKLLDLSCLGLPRWNPAIFELSELQTLKLNDNELTEVPSELSNLEQLTTLDISNNKIESLPKLDFDKMPSLASISLNGNPVEKSISTTVLRQLAQPDQVPGKSPAQVLRSVLLEASKKTSKHTRDALTETVDSGTSALPMKPALQPSAQAPNSGEARSLAPPLKEEKKIEGKASLEDYMKSLGDSEEEYSDDFQASNDENVPKPLAPANKGQGSAGKKEAMAQGGERAGAPGKPVSRATHWDGSDSDDVKQPRPAASTVPSKGVESVSSKRTSSGSRMSNEGISRKHLDKEGSTNAEAEVARLQAQVKELQAQLASSGRSGDSQGKINLASTLPSRLHALDENASADKLKVQLQEEQTRAKRLERDNKKLQERLQESSTGSSTSAPHVELSEIQEGEILSNSGGFSIIYKGTWHQTPVAIKKLFDASNSRENLAEMDNEVEKLGKLRHPNILSLLAVHRKPPVYSIILEIVAGGSLYQLLHAKHSFNYAPGTAKPSLIHDLIRINESMALALAFMHARNVVHRDVKSHNVLLSPHLEAKLCDFGLARMKSELMTGAMQFAGTPQYMAPELLSQQKYSEKVDVWAFGVLLWESIAGDIPFANLDVPEIRELVTTGKVLQLPHSAPRPIPAVIKACWTADSKVRPTMMDVLAQIST